MLPCLSGLLPGPTALFRVSCTNTSGTLFTKAWATHQWLQCWRKRLCFPKEVPQGRLERHEPFPEPWRNIVRPNHVQAPGRLVHEYDDHALALETHERLKTGFHNFPHPLASTFFVPPFFHNIPWDLKVIIHWPSLGLRTQQSLILRILINYKPLN